MNKIKWKGSALLGPIPPVLVSCGTMEHPNVLTVAWTGIINTRPAKTYVSIRPERHSYAIIKESKEFIINLPTAEMVRTIDYCGVKSGKKENKFLTQRLTALPAEDVQCPMIAQAPLSLVCKVTDCIPLGSHDMFLADILSIYVTEHLLNADGKLTLAKAGLCAYAHGEYFALGKKIGEFGFSVRKKKKHSATQERAKKR